MSRRSGALKGIAARCGALAGAFATLGLGVAGVPPALAEDVPHRLPIGDPERRGEVSAEIDALVETRSLEVLTPSQLPARLLDTRLLLIGESHTSEEFHRVQEIVLRELHRSGRKLIVGLEMMPPESQPALDQWSAGELGDRAFLEWSGWYEHWGYRWEYYRSIFELLRDERVPIRGMNVPRAVVRAAREQGFDGLAPEDRRRLPKNIQPPTEDYRRLFLSYFSSEDGSHDFADDQFEGFLRAQTAWDAAMAKNAAAAATEHPRALVVVLVGSGHVAYGLGIARQAAPLLDGSIATLIPVPVAEDGSPESVAAGYADYVWGVAREPWTRYPSLGLSTTAVGDGDGDRVGRSVLFVGEESAAARAGLEAGDVLLSIDGRAVDGPEIVRRAMASKHWGDTVELRYERGGEENKVTAILRRLP